MSAVDIGTLEDFAPGEAARVVRDGHAYVVVRIDDDVYVLDDRCSHEDFSLAEGEVDVATCEIECARHGAMFDLRDGQPSSLPATRPVARYDVIAREGRLEVVVS